MMVVVIGDTGRISPSGISTLIERHQHYGMRTPSLTGLTG